MDLDRWETSVREAVSADDREALAALFSQAVAGWGREEASRHWLVVISGYDGSAVTG